MCPNMKQLFGGGLVPQEWFALFECTLVLQQWFALFGYFVVFEWFALFGGHSTPTLLQHWLQASLSLAAFAFRVAWIEWILMP